MKDLGLRRLKDLAAPEQLFQLDDAGFTTDFPPLKTLDERPNNLPRTLTSFFGREEEVSRITGLLAWMQFGPYPPRRASWLTRVIDTGATWCAWSFHTFWISDDAGKICQTSEDGIRRNAVGNSEH